VVATVVPGSLEKQRNTPVLEHERGGGWHRGSRRQQALQRSVGCALGLTGERSLETEGQGWAGERCKRRESRNG